ncbi:HutD family protein [Rhodoferax sp.]|uniref:HutD/Ves family protein n=1 Tax=Rhodoferax sp. TaxID=50421 RepID=UPI0026039EDC|nr:HutD family protein [Rhodoferax sp.]MDD2925703.1 HutD family protein [Rhodoferax sp.]
MNWQQVRLDDVPPSPWRNGGGVTRELLAWPDSKDWLWRLSVAEVAHSGPFSCFAGVQRWFAVLGQGGVRLTLRGQSHELTCHSAPLCFDGAEPADCELLDGATQDFNLMARSSRATARMMRVSGHFCIMLDAAKTIAIYAINSRAELHFDDQSLAVPANTLVWQALPAGGALQLRGTDFLWMEMAPSG